MSVTVERPALDLRPRDWVQWRAVGGTCDGEPYRAEVLTVSDGCLGLRQLLGWNPDGSMRLQPRTLGWQDLPGLTKIDTPVAPQAAGKAAAGALVPAEPAQNAGAPVVMMSEAEARAACDQVKGHIQGARAILLDLEEREGWRALGYESWRACATREFGQSSAQVYRLLQAGKLERELAPGDEVGSIPESHLRELGRLETQEQRQAAWALAGDLAGVQDGGRVTAAHVRQAVETVAPELASPVAPPVAPIPPVSPIGESSQPAAAPAAPPDTRPVVIDAAALPRYQRVESDVHGIVYRLQQWDADRKRWEAEVLEVGKGSGITVGQRVEIPGSRMEGRYFLVGNTPQPLPPQPSLQGTPAENPVRPAPPREEPRVVKSAAEIAADRIAARTAGPAPVPPSPAASPTPAAKPGALKTAEEKIAERAGKTLVPAAPAVPAKPTLPADWQEKPGTVIVAAPLMNRLRELEIAPVSALKGYCAVVEAAEAHDLDPDDAVGYLRQFLDYCYTLAGSDPEAVLTQLRAPYDAPYDAAGAAGEAAGAGEASDGAEGDGDA